MNSKSSSTQTPGEKTDAQQPEEPKLVHVTLLQPHTDAGTDYEAGATIEVNEVIAGWLVTNKIGARA